MDAETTLQELREEVARFVRERDWEVFHTPKNLAESVSIEAAELMELFQWTDPGAQDVAQDPELMERVRHEMADVLIYIIALANVLNADISEAFREKMRMNREKYPTPSQR